MRPLKVLAITGTLAATLVSFPAAAADRDFKEIVRAISDEFDTKPVHIPLFGLVNAFTRVVKPAGAKHIDLAVFDDLGSQDHDISALGSKIRKAVGEDWSPFIQVRSSNDGNTSDIVLVYVRPDGHDFKLLITTVEPNQATVVQVKLDPKGMQKWIRDPVRSATHTERWNRDREDNEP